MVWLEEEKKRVPGGCSFVYYHNAVRKIVLFPSLYEHDRPTSDRHCSDTAFLPPGSVAVEDSVTRPAVSGDLACLVCYEGY